MSVNAKFASILLWLFLLWVAWGIVQGSRNAHWTVNSTIVVPTSIILGIAGYLYIKRKLGIRPDPRNRDLGHLLSLPFIKFPNEIKITVRLTGDVTPPSQGEWEQMLRSDVFPRLSDDIFICSDCKQRRVEFVAKYHNRKFVDVHCLKCDQNHPPNYFAQPANSA